MIEFESVSRFDSKARARRSRHSFVEDRLLLIRSGRFSARIQGQAIEGGVGDVVLFPSGVAVTDRSYAGDLLRCVHVLFRWPGRPASIPLQVADTEGRMALLGEWLLGESAAHVMSRPAIRHGYVAALAGEYLRLARKDEPALVRGVREYGVRHLAEPFQLHDLAGHMHLHERYLIRKFKRLCGMTPMAFLRRQRLEQARRLAYETDAPLKAIADQVGIGDPYQLSRLFKACFGVGIRELRKARLR